MRQVSTSTLLALLISAGLFVAVVFVAHAYPAQAAGGPRGEQGAIRR